MARVKRAVGAHKKRRRVFKLAKGYFGAKSKQYKSAKQAVMKSMQYAYVGRKLKKRDMRRLWIVRINAEARQNGISYSQFMNGLKQSGIDLNRKILADMAVNDKAAFKELADTAKKKVQA
ncbi:50S ribosomal protein L20 [Christensenellaceae bacterium OttesenSCG-928-K19]|nr:50S ribosomal protein L20 [Christensenellaceae bacterium OttesenSCG-928-K19]